MINKIEIKGYKSIKDLTLELKPINILIGSNGVGKSNFIGFFKLVNTIYEQRLQNFSLSKGADSILSFGRKNTSVLKGYLEFNATKAYGFTLNSTRIINYLFKENTPIFIEISMAQVGKKHCLQRIQPKLL
jgi:predicted ATPase